MFVQRGWYGGENIRLTSSDPELEKRLQAKEAHIENLTRRLAELEDVVEALAPGNTTLRASLTTENVSDVQFAAVGNSSRSARLGDRSGQQQR